MSGKPQSFVRSRIRAQAAGGALSGDLTALTNTVRRITEYTICSRMEAGDSRRMGEDMPAEEHKLEGQREQRLRAARRVVIKVGTSTVTGADGELCAERVRPIVQSIAKLMRASRQ